jgi:heme/copper-type cytochrome/quinol oxidase subunit 2
MVVLMRTSLVLSAFLVATAASGGGAASRQGRSDAGQPVVIGIAAERFSFTPSEIKTAVGTTLRFQLRSDDTDHGFHIIGTDINIEIPKRGRGLAMVEFTPDRAGRYTFECSHVCGAGHSFMRGVIVVRDRESE